jgi:DNA-binding CsgD family transcriptional regulator
MTPEQYAMLTPTERDVLRRIGHGRRPGEIAGELNRSVSTVNNHLQAARAKLNVSDSVTAARALLALESTGKSVPRHELPIENDSDLPLSPPSQPSEPWLSATLHEERAGFEHAPDMDPERLRRSREEPPHAEKYTPWHKVGFILCLTLLLLACISLAPEMAATFQLIIDRLYPLNE